MSDANQAPIRTHPWSEIRDRLKADPKRWKRIQAGKAALRAMHELAALRERQGMTQAEVATALDVSQARVSKIEHQEDVYFSTLREYVAANHHHARRVEPLWTEQEQTDDRLATTTRSPYTIGTITLREPVAPAPEA